MHGAVVDVFAFQEALVIEAVFGITILVMMYRGFRRWIQHKEKMGHLAARQTAERDAQYGAHMERVEARLAALERIAADGGGQEAARIDSRPTNPLPDPNAMRERV